MSDVLDQLRGLDPERDASSGAPPLGWLRALLDAQPEPPRRRRPFAGRRRPSPPRAPRPRHRRPIAVAVTLACLAALALVAIAILGGSSTAPRRDALVPAHGEKPLIVHIVVDALQPGPMIQTGEARTRGQLNGPIERWSVADRSRWREVSSLDGVMGTPGGTIDTAFASGVARTRESWSRKTRLRRAPRRAGADFGSEIPLLTALAPLTHSDAGRALVTGVADPRAFVEQMIRSGDLRAAGEATRDGRQLLRYAGASEATRTRYGGYRPAVRATYLLDPRSYAPVEIETRYDVLPPSPRRPQRFVNRSTLKFPVYETLPLTRATEPLLHLGGPTG